MELNIKYVEKMTEKDIEKEVLQLLLLCDEAFEPPLSSSRLKENPYATKEEKLQVYLDEKRETHSYILAYEKTQLVGMMNVEKDGSDYQQVVEALKENQIQAEHLYFIDTMAILPTYRGKGIGQSIYHTFEKKLLQQEKEAVVLRMASMTNEPQMHLFKKQGYRLLFEKPYARDERVMKGTFYKVIETGEVIFAYIIEQLTKETHND